MRPLILVILASLTLAAAVDKAGAEAAVARGWAALDASNSDPRKSVDAALAFSEALPYFVEAGDDESARELQADIFWARKRMRSDDLDTYLAAKRGDAGTAKAVETMTMVVDRPIAASEAADYFAKAEAFAKAHPSDHLKLAIRYFEVASRFPGTQEAMDAQKRSLDEQVQAKAGDGKAIAKAIKIDKQQPAAAKAGKDAVQVQVVSAGNFDDEKLGTAIRLNGMAKVTASSQWDDWAPDRAFPGKRGGSQWAMADQSTSGWYKVEMRKPVTARTIVVFARTTASGNDDWGNGTIAINGTEFPMVGFSGSHAVVVTLPAAAPIVSIKLVAKDGRQAPGLAGFAMYP